MERAASAPEVDRQAFASERTALEEALDRNDPEATREALERLDALNAKHAPAAGGQGEAAAREANPQPAARPDFGTTQVLKPWLEPVLGAPAAVLRAAARRLRLVMLLVALLATLAMGLKTLWLSAPAWGGWNDYFAAIAFGLASQLGATFVLSEIAGKLTPRS